MAAIDTIARTLQARYTYTEIDTYLAAFGIAAPSSTEGFNSKWVYSKLALKNVPLDVIGKIADDLDLGALARVSAQANPPVVWKGTSEFRLFISHLSKDKDKATRLRDCLKKYGINAFVAHEDIDPTLEWQSEIERALFAMDAMVAIHTPGFAASFWTQQEIGFALGRGAKVISFKMGEDPKGFISKRQALPRRDKTAEQVAAEINTLLSNDEQTKGRLSEAQKVKGVFISQDEDISF
jgi:signal recognition particle subunit SEC65